MTSAFATHIDKVLAWEGGYVNDPADPGGETNMGISKRAFPDEDIKNMTRERALHIYETRYWIPAHCEQVPAQLQAIHLDTAVLCGVRTAIKILQRASGAPADGFFGIRTLEFARTCTVQEYAVERMAYHEGLVVANPKLARFINGWRNRVNSYLP